MKRYAPHINIREKDRKDADLMNAVELLEHGRDKDAFQFLQLSANNNNPTAQYLLGLLYATGNGVEQSFVHAVQNFTNAAEQDQIGRAHV